MVEWGSRPTPEKLPDVDCGDFWPAVSGEKFRTLYRLPAELPAAVIVEQLMLAAVNARNSLQKWRRSRTEISLADVPQEKVGERGELALLWERAVYCLAKAELLRETLTVDRRKEAENAAKSGEETEAKYREFAADAISMICGVDAITCETI